MSGMMYIMEHGKRCADCLAVVMPGKEKCSKCGSTNLKPIEKTMFVCKCCGYIVMGSEPLPDDYQCPRCCGQANGGQPQTGYSFVCYVCGATYIERSLDKAGTDEGVCESCSGVTK